MPKHNKIIHIEGIPQTKHLENFDTTGRKKTQQQQQQTQNRELKLK